MDKISIVEDEQSLSSGDEEGDYESFITNDQFKKDSERKKIFDLGM